MVTAAYAELTIPIKWESINETPYIEGPLYVGSATIPITAMYLLNYEETVVISAECLNCPLPKYDPSFSIKYRQLNTTLNEDIEIPITTDKVIKAQCRGLRDKICIDYDYCSEAEPDDFVFLVVTKYTGNTNIGIFNEDGMVGLTPNPKTKIESLPEYLVRSQLISKHTLHFNQTALTLGSNITYPNLHWSPYTFSPNTSTWSFPGYELSLNHKLLYKPQIEIILTNFEPGLRL